MAKVFKFKKRLGKKFKKPWKKKFGGSKRTKFRKYRKKFTKKSYGRNNRFKKSKGNKFKSKKSFNKFKPSGKGKIFAQPWKKKAISKAGVKVSTVKTYYGDFKEIQCEWVYNIKLQTTFEVNNVKHVNAYRPSLIQKECIADKLIQQNVLKIFKDEPGGDNLSYFNAMIVDPPIKTKYHKIEVDGSTKPYILSMYSPLTFTPLTCKGIMSMLTCNAESEVQLGNRISKFSLMYDFVFTDNLRTLVCTVYNLAAYMNRVPNFYTEHDNSPFAYAELVQGYISSTCDKANKFTYNPRPLVRTAGGAAARSRVWQTPTNILTAANFRAGYDMATATYAGYVVFVGDNVAKEKAIQMNPNWGIPTDHPCEYRVVDGLTDVATRENNYHNYSLSATTTCPEEYYTNMNLLYKDICCYTLFNYGSQLHHYGAFLRYITQYIGADNFLGPYVPNYTGLKWYLQNGVFALNQTKKSKIIYKPKEEPNFHVVISPIGCRIAMTMAYTRNYKPFLALMKDVIRKKELTANLTEGAIGMFNRLEPLYNFKVFNAMN